MQAFIVGLLLVIYYSIHSILAHKKVKSFLTKKGVSKKYYRLLFNLVSILGLIPIYVTYKRADLFLLFENSILHYVGLMLVVIGVILLLIALSQYNLSEFAGTQQLSQDASLAPEMLKTSGINSMVRHPLYFALLNVLWGGFLYNPTLALLVLSTVSSLYLYIGTKLEEQKLVEEFGQDYIDYQHKVGMLIPFIK